MSKEYVLLLDGKEVMRGTEFACVKYVHQNHSYSFDHACKYEGYKLVPSDERVALDAAVAKALDLGPETETK
jgi:hypothetical protein